MLQFEISISQFLKVIIVKFKAENLWELLNKDNPLIFFKA